MLARQGAMRQDNQAEARSSLGKIILVSGRLRERCDDRPICKHDKQTKQGKDRNGNQRWMCALGGVTSTDRNEDEAERIASLV
jgi:transposase-like protein